MSLRTSLKLPREHGAWAIFYVPLVMGVTVAGKNQWGGVFAISGDDGPVHFARISVDLLAGAGGSIMGQPDHCTIN